MEDFYAIKYYNDEIRLHSSFCLNPMGCVCDKEAVKCGYSPDEAKQKFIEYYQGRIDYLKKITANQFMRDQGFYNYPEE